ncbi:Golgi-associated plant pathogenesis-related protein 1-like [Armigeres subalbatus]|uniref:Golgi-associated plant pathogenesis-related protein 1-like n=1 Tax=Armigeres subalbatus TaxID=124917 RepID=UPI002ED34BF9
MSYTRKVTYIKSSGCTSGVQRTVTVTQQSCNGSEWVQVPQQPQPTTVVYRTVQPITTTPEVSHSRSGGSASPFDAAVLEEHNRLRAKHSAAPLTLDPAISQYAQQWANNIASRNVMQHRSNNSYGENLYASFGRTNITGEEVVHSWYNEIKDYRFGQPNPGNFGQVGHFTQVVWKNSKRLGVGIAKTGNNVYVVCNYDPPGNYGGQYAANVTRS